MILSAMSAKYYYTCAMVFEMVRTFLILINSYLLFVKINTKIGDHTTWRSDLSSSQFCLVNSQLLLLRSALFDEAIKNRRV